ncbi:hypothetical protein NL108_015735 [Boleophthalmus pectinirostris]|nr:hypothetical protein NL108_015735 [Boleophthalmus pectinirostris]
MRPGLDQDWTRTGPGLDQDWTRAGPGLDQGWTRTGPGLDQDWTRTGPGLDQLWAPPPVAFDYSSESFFRVSCLATRDTPLFPGRCDSELDGGKSRLSNDSESESTRLRPL